MKPRNEALYAECERIVDLKLQIDPYKLIAQRTNSSVQTVRALISRMQRERRKSTNVLIHVEPKDAKIAELPKL